LYLFLSVIIKNFFLAKVIGVTNCSTHVNFFYLNSKFYAYMSVHDKSIGFVIYFSSNFVKCLHKGIIMYFTYIELKKAKLKLSLKENKKKMHKTVYNYKRVKIE